MLTYDEHGNVVRDKIILTRGTLQKIIDTIKSEIAHAYKWLFPVGFIWSTSKAPTNGGDPNDLFPGTTWVRLKDAFICAAGDNDIVDSDPEHDTPHGSDTRADTDLPAHKHDIGSRSGLTGEGGALTGSVQYLLTPEGQSKNVGGVFTNDSIGGTWYGVSHSPNHESISSIRLDMDAHDHTYALKTRSDTSLGNGNYALPQYSTMSVQPKRFYKYYWERTA